MYTHTYTSTNTHANEHTCTLRECILGFVCTACWNAVANTPAPPCPIRQSALNTSGTMPIEAWDRSNVVKALTKSISYREWDLAIGNASLSDVQIAWDWQITSCFEYSGSCIFHRLWHRYVIGNICDFSMSLFFGTKNLIGSRIWYYYGIIRNRINILWLITDV